MKQAYDIMAANVAKAIKKSAQVHLQRVKDEQDVGRDEVYICNGYFVVRVPYGVYEAAYRPKNPMFIPLGAGERATWRANTSQTMPEVNPAGIDCADVWQTIEKGADIPGTVTAMLREKEDGRGLMRVIVYDGEQVTAVDEDFYKIVAPIECGTVRTAGRAGAVHFSGGMYDGMEVIIMPIRLTGAQTIRDLFPCAEHSRQGAAA